MDETVANEIPENACFSPEQIFNHQHGAEVDVWSLGTIYYRMLTGFRPFEMKEEQFSKVKYEETMKNGFFYFPKTIQVSGDCLKIISYMLCNME